MTLAKTLHDVLLSREESIPAGSIHEFENTKFLELVGQSAVRAATVEETARHRRQHGTVEPEMVSARAELEGRATALGVEFRASISDEKLLDRVIEAEAGVRD